MITIKDVARAAGVSASTVSRVLAGSSRISPETHERVHAAMASMNYHPNAIARSLARNSSHTVGLVIARPAEQALANPFFPEVMRGIRSTLAGAGYNLLLSMAGSPAEEQSSCLQLLRGRRVDGVILTSSRSQDPLVEDLLAEEFPFVLIGRGPANRPVNWVNNDNITVGAMAVEHLISRGHRRIAMIEGPGDLTVTLDRRDGYRGALDRAGLAARPGYEQDGGFSKEGGFRAMYRLLALPEPPTAIFCTDDSMAIGALTALKEQGKARSVALVGVNDDPLTALIDPPLSTIRIPIFDLGVVAATITDKGELNAFPTVAASGKGPDIMFGLPHDNLSPIYKAGLLSPVPDGLVNPADYEESGLNAVSFDGKMYSLPFSMETYALFYRTDKIQQPPKTWSEFTDDANKFGFMYDIKNFYFSYAFLHSEGGYVFKNSGGKYDTKDIGLANAGAVQGLQMIGDMVLKNKWMGADVTGDIAKGKFQAGQTAMYISGPWDIGGFKSANVPFKVAPMPILADGKAFQPFSGIQVAFVANTSKHQKEAWDLVKYLDENASLPIFKLSNRIPVIKKILNSSDVQSNETMERAEAAEPMPNIPEMSQVWTPMADALTLVVSGKGIPDQVAKDAVTKIQQGIATGK